MESQTASEVMELKVRPRAGLRIKRPALIAGHENICPDVFVAKIDIEIGKVQNPMLAETNIDSTATGPSAPDFPVASTERVREFTAKARVLVNRSDLVQLGQAHRAAT